MLLQESQLRSVLNDLWRLLIQKDEWLRGGALPEEANCYRQIETTDWHLDSRNARGTDISLLDRCLEHSSAEGS